ncbi:MAG: ABC transporter permease [Deltaproteobacteria bacterium]|nr:ABC transporter permease [Deltaproteobacteria bacterium]
MVSTHKLVNILQAYIIRRLFFLFFVIFGVSLLVFSIQYSYGPERRAMLYVDSPQQAKNIPELIERYGFKDPIYKQYFRYVKEMSMGNFGYSLVAAMPVWDAFLQYLPVTIELNLFVVPLFIIIGIWLGKQAGIKRNTTYDHVTRILAIIGWSLPTFLFALILLMIFYGQFGLFEPSMLSANLETYILENPDKYIQYTGMYTIDGILNGELDITFDAIKHLFLPVLTQVIVIVAILMRVMRSSMVEEISKDYVITAQAKGVDSKTIFNKHVQRNALIPVITIAGQLAALSMEGSIAVEMIFNRHGIGNWLANAALKLDTSVIMFMCLFMAVIFVFTNLIIDLLYAYIDPRIRLT